MEKRRQKLQTQRNLRLVKIVNGTCDKEGEEMKSNEENREDEELIYIRLLGENARLKEVNSSSSFIKISEESLD